MPDTTLLSAINTGANLVNMGWERQDRLMQFRSQAALNAIRERQMAAEADAAIERAQLYKERLLTEQQNRMDEAAMTLATRDIVKQKMDDGLEESEATAQALAIVGGRYPAFAQKLSSAYENYVRAQQIGKATPADIIRQQHYQNTEAETSRHNKVMEQGGGFEPKIGQVTGPDGKQLFYFQGSKNSARLITASGELGGEASPVFDPDGNTIGFQIQGANGPHFISKPTAESMSPSDRAELASAWRGVERVDKDLSELPETGSGTDVEEAKRVVLLNQKLAYKKRISALTQQKKKAAPAAPQTKQGQAVKLGTLVEQGGVRYRYQGGDVNDRKSWIEVK